MFSLHSLMDISNLPELCQEFIEELVRLHSTETAEREYSEKFLDWCLRL